MASLQNGSRWAGNSEHQVASQSTTADTSYDSWKAATTSSAVRIALAQTTAGSAVSLTSSLDPSAQRATYGAQSPTNQQVEP